MCRIRLISISYQYDVIMTWCDVITESYCDVTGTRRSSCLKLLHTNLNNIVYDCHGISTNHSHVNHTFLNGAVWHIRVIYDTMTCTCYMTYIWCTHSVGWKEISHHDILLVKTLLPPQDAVSRVLFEWDPICHLQRASPEEIQCWEPVFHIPSQNLGEDSDLRWRHLRGVVLCDILDCSVQLSKCRYLRGGQSVRLRTVSIYFSLFWGAKDSSHHQGVVYHDTWSSTCHMSSHREMYMYDIMTWCVPLSTLNWIRLFYLQSGPSYHYQIYSTSSISSISILIFTSKMTHVREQLKHGVCGRGGGIHWCRSQTSKWWGWMYGGGRSCRWGGGMGSRGGFLNKVFESGGIGTFHLCDFLAWFESLEGGHSLYTIFLGGGLWWWGRQLMIWRWITWRLSTLTLRKMTELFWTLSSAKRGAICLHGPIFVKISSVIIPSWSINSPHQSAK